MKLRIQNFFKISSLLSYLSNAQLIEKINSGKISHGWGHNSVIEVDGNQIFTKRIPITELEFENQFNTSNLFNLPMFYNYGVGSAGFNCWRELQMHIKTTNMVLQNIFANFPMLYHYRINKKMIRKSDEWTAEKLENYVNYWNDNIQIKKYITARENSEYEIILFMEFIPFTVNNWLDDSKEKINLYLRDSVKINNYLSKNGIIHFDTHSYNYLTDGHMIYLSDFGLALDLDFQLSQEEKEFFLKNTMHDYGRSILELENLLFDKIFDEININYFEEKYYFNENTDSDKINIEVYNNIEEIFKYLNLSSDYLNTLKMLKEVILLNSSFFDQLKKNPQKNNLFPNKEMEDLLVINGDDIEKPDLWVRC